MHPNSKWWSRPSAGAAGHADGWLAVDAGGGAGDGDEGMVVVGLVVADGVLMVAIGDGVVVVGAGVPLIGSPVIAGRVAGHWALRWWSPASGVGARCWWLSAVFRHRPARGGSQSASAAPRRRGSRSARPRRRGRPTRLAAPDASRTSLVCHQ
ncbi:hypothetical protein I553_3076 [Mycobacterium xenopi 4042]|uniref:Uncharacterized protein n=1 Tax=Mycobacterium xenopi 4042 TaxID=1299334 RepID=X8E3I4_MYCXE|nr:hypothetical protein I553_3076 [Mycobacterium xenopi 4042]